MNFRFWIFDFRLLALVLALAVCARAADVPPVVSPPKSNATKAQLAAWIKDALVREAQLRAVLEEQAKDKAAQTQAIARIDAALEALKAVGPQLFHVSSVGASEQVGVDFETTAPVRRVDFFLEGDLIGSAEAAPWLVDWKPKKAGTFKLSAVINFAAGPSESIAATVKVLP